MERDDGNMLVLEAMLISLILLGAAYGVQTLQGTRATEQERPRQQLTKLATDALVLLEGLDLNGSLLDVYVAEAHHCARDTSPAATDCDIRRPRNLSFRLDSYLPTGAGYQVSLGNGVGDRILYTSPYPRGEAVATSLTYTPSWNHTFVAPELSCYEAGMDVNVSMLPLLRGRTTNATWANVTVGATEWSGIAAHAPRWWNVTLPAATRPVSGTIEANVTGRAWLNGSTTYASCSMGGIGSSIVTAMRQASFAPTATSVPLGQEVGFTADLVALGALPGVSIASVNVSLYEPLPPRVAPNTWSRAAVLDTSGTTTRTATWEVPSDSLYGTHVAVMSIALDVGATRVVAHKLTTVDVALPSGHVPIDPPYRAVLQAWFPEWG